MEQQQEQFSAGKWNNKKEKSREYAVTIYRVSSSCDSNAGRQRRHKVQLRKKLVKAYDNRPVHANACKLQQGFQIFIYAYECI